MYQGDDCPGIDVDEMECFATVDICPSTCQFLTDLFYIVNHVLTACVAYPTHVFSSWALLSSKVTSYDAIPSERIHSSF